MSFSIQAMESSLVNLPVCSVYQTIDGIHKTIQITGKLCLLAGQSTACCCVCCVSCATCYCCCQLVRNKIHPRKPNPPAPLNQGQDAKLDQEGGKEKSVISAPTMRRDDLYSFASLAGQQPEAVMRLMAYIKNPEIRRRYQEFNVQPYKGILLYGPPGTGKTALARAIAGEAGAPFFTLKCSQILSPWQGQSEQNIAKIFADAHAAIATTASKMAIIFFDELDAIAPKRKDSSKELYSSTVIQQLLAEMDGYDKREGVVVLGATNRLENLDEAIRRPGRFDVTIHVGYPDAIKQRQIVDLWLSKTKYEDAKSQKEKEECIAQVMECLRKKEIQATPALLAELVKEAGRRTAHDLKAEHVTSKMVLDVVAAYCATVKK